MRSQTAEPEEQRIKPLLYSLQVPSQIRHPPHHPPQRLFLMNAPTFTLRVTLRVNDLAPLGSTSSKNIAPPQVRDIT
jgi:hypothetical protein